MRVAAEPRVLFVLTLQQPLLACIGPHGFAVKIKAAIFRMALL
jgi:hypothetical protein